MPEETEAESVKEVPAVALTGETVPIIGFAKTGLATRKMAAEEATAAKRNTDRCIYKAQCITASYERIFI